MAAMFMSLRYHDFFYFSTFFDLGVSSDAAVDIIQAFSQAKLTLLTLLLLLELSDSIKRNNLENL